MIASVALLAASRHPQSWTELVPRPVLAWMLELRAPDPSPNPSEEIPDPVPRVSLAPTPWQMMVWNQGYANTIRRWGDLVATDAEALSTDHSRLIRALGPMNTWLANYQPHHPNGTSYAWVVDREIQRQVDRFDAMARVGRGDVTVPGSRAQTVKVNREQLFMLACQYPRQRPLRGATVPSRTPAPLSLLVEMLRAPSPQVRAYAITFVAWESDSEHGIPSLLEVMSANDPDEAVRALAQWAIDQ